MMNGPPIPAKRMFAGETHAAEHTCDHALTRPEAHDWALVLPGYAELVNPRPDESLRRLGGSFFPGPACAEAKTLLDLYVAALVQAIEDARRLGFWWESADGKYRKWFGLGLDGIYVIWDERVIQSGMFPASANYPPATNPGTRVDNPLPRQKPMSRPFRLGREGSAQDRYRLFRESYYLVSKAYAEEYYRGSMSAAGGTIFVEDSPPRMGKWQRWLADRPAQEHESEVKP